MSRPSFLLISTYLGKNFIFFLAPGRPPNQILGGVGGIKHGANIYKDTKPLKSAFLKIDLLRKLAEGFYLSEAPDPLPPRYTLYENVLNIPLYLFPQGKGGRGVREPVRRLEKR
jgi:hypothetical protein